MEVNKVIMNEEDVIDLLDLFRQYLKHWWLIVLGFIIGTLLAGAYAFLLAKPVYEASSLIYIRGTGSTVASLQDLQIGSQLTKDYEVIFASRPILENVIEELDLDITWKELKQKVSLENLTDTRILRVSVVDGDAKLAKNIVNTLVEKSMEAVREIDAKEPYLIEKAVTDWTKVSTSSKKMLVIGALLGTILVLGILTVNYLLNDTIRSADDVEKSLQLPVLCIVPECDMLEFHRSTKKRRKHKH